MTARRITVIISIVLFAGILFLVFPKSLRTEYAEPAEPNEPAELAESSTKTTCPDCNVILILIDTLRADHMGCYGYARKTSPHMDTLASKGILFKNMSAQASWTRPGVASILTGLYPKIHGANTRQDKLREEFILVSEALKEHNYSTYAYVTNGNAGPNVGFDQGYDSYNYLREKRQRRGIHVPSDVVTDEVLKLVDTLSSKTKNFVYVHYSDPHDPYLPKETSFSKSNTEKFTPEFFENDGLNQYSGSGKNKIIEEMINAYDDEILFNDKGIGRIVESLAQNGMSDNTIIAVTSDHGEEFYEHGGIRHGLTLYEEQLRVPLIIYVPNSKARIVHKLANQIDIVPTLLSLIGIPLTHKIDGVDVLSDKEANHTSFAELDLDGRVKFSAKSIENKIIVSRGDHYSIEKEKYKWFEEGFHTEFSGSVLELKMQSFNKERKIQVRFDDAGMVEGTISPGLKTVRIPMGEDNLHKVSVRTLTPCQRPYDLGGSDDKRCLSFRVHSSSNVALEDLMEFRQLFYNLATDPDELRDINDMGEKNSDSAHLKQEIRDYISSQKKSSANKETIVLDEELVEALKALGYL